MKEAGSPHAAADARRGALRRPGRAGLVLALAAGLAGVVTAWSLGNWQTRRAEGKLAVEARWQAAEAAAPATPRAAQVQDFGAELPRRVRLAGRYLHAQSVWLDNRPLDGKAGLLLLTPLVLADSAGGRATAVLVLRGWAPRDPRDRTKLPAVMQSRLRRLQPGDRTGGGALDRAAAGRRGRRVAARLAAAFQRRGQASGLCRAVVLAGRPDRGADPRARRACAPARRRPRCASHPPTNLRG